MAVVVAPAAQRSVELLDQGRHGRTDVVADERSQLSQQDALDQLQDVLDEVPRVRADLGYPPLVTPTSQATRLLNRRRTAQQIIDDMVDEAVALLEEGLPQRVRRK